MKDAFVGATFMVARRICGGNPADRGSRPYERTGRRAIPTVHPDSVSAAHRAVHRARIPRVGDAARSDSHSSVFTSRFSLLSALSSFLAPLFTLLRKRIPDRSPLGLARTYPATILILSTIILCDLVTWGQDADSYQVNVLNRLGLSWDLLMQGQVWRVVTSTFVQTVPGIHFSMIVVLLTSYVLAETFAGTVPALCVIFLSDWISSLLGMTIVRIIAATGSAEAMVLLHIPDAGSSATGHGAYALAATTLLPRKLAIGLFGLLLAVTAVLWFEQHIDASIAHTISSLFGGAVGWFIVRPHLYPDERGRV